MQQPRDLAVSDRRRSASSHHVAPGESLEDGSDAVDEATAAMLAATALGLSIVPRAGAVQTLRRLADSRTAALDRAIVQLDELREVDASAVDQAGALLTAAAEESQFLEGNGDLRHWLDRPGHATVARRPDQETDG